MYNNFISDKQLITNYLEGDEESLKILVKRYLRPIYSFVYRFIGDSHSAEDITQEVFIKVWRNLKKFNQQKSFKTWIFSIAKNTSIDWFRKKKTVPFSNFSAQSGSASDEENMLTKTLVDPAPLPDKLLERANTSQMLTSVIEKLSQKYRTVLFLRYNDHFNFREIAEALGEPLYTIKSRHRRALIMLKKFLPRY